MCRALAAINQIWKYFAIVLCRCVCETKPIAFIYTYTHGRAHAGTLCTATKLRHQRLLFKLRCQWIRCTTFIQHPIVRTEHESFADTIIMRLSMTCVCVWLCVVCGVPFRQSFPFELKIVSTRLWWQDIVVYEVYTTMFDGYMFAHVNTMHNGCTQ